METMEAVETICSEQDQQQQLNREVVQQLNDAKYASLTSRAVSDAARTLIDRLIKLVDGGAEGSRKNKRSEKARFALSRAMEGFVGDLLRAYADL